MSGTLEAMERLENAKTLTKSEHDALKESYLFCTRGPSQTPSPGWAGNRFPSDRPCRALQIGHLAGL